MDGTHFDDTVKSGWAAGCPGDGGVEIGHLDDMKAAQLLFRVCIGSVKDLGLAV